ncbi:hypothetical protein [uncultured Methanosphaera sp.]|uniref:beta strand repeat-containing protein n=1 Tax=uncultured Methanosphaera sp. TaxID=262501 RepID=UPI000DC51302|nr:hypothetical protein [uncultured Methanosphaera sp.]RAP43728.1 MAG: hypothetical protein BZ134_05910 [Methanosphaera sp. SHI1033]
MNNKKVFLLVATLILLFIGISAVSAANSTDQSVTTTAQDTNTITTSTQDIQTIENNNVDYAVKSQPTTSKKINTTSAIKHDSKKSLKTAENITVTDGNYNRYFSGDSGTKNTITANSTIILTGSFYNKTFYLDKQGLVLTGSDATINNGQVFLTEDAINSTVTNLKIVTTGYQDAIHNEAIGAKITHNTINITNNDDNGDSDVDYVTQGIYNNVDNVTISNNNVTVRGHAMDIDWVNGDRAGLANTFGIFNWGGNNVLIENNIADVGKADECDGTYYGTIDGIEIKNGDNITINNNTVTISGARFVYAINALDTISNINITNNKLHMTGDRYVDGVQIGNYATNCTITGNNVTGHCYNTTIYTADNEALAFGIITSTMGGVGPTININVSDNNIKLNAPIVYSMEIYQTQNSTISNNNITGVGNYTMGIELAHSTNATITGNYVNTTGNSNIPINEIVEEVRPGNTGIQIQQNSDNAKIINNTVYTIDVGNNSKAVSINGTNNVAILNNTLLSNDVTGDEAVTITGNLTNITISDNIKPVLKNDAIINVVVPTNPQTNTNITLVATATDAKTSVPLNGTVVFKFNGVTLKDNNGNPIKIKMTNGVATLNYTLSGFGGKTYRVTAVYGNDSYNRIEYTTNMTIQKVNVSFIQKEITAYAGQNILLNETILDQNGNQLKGTTKAAVKVNGKTIAHMNIVNGLLLTNITLPSGLRAGDNNFTIVLGDNNRYYSMTTTSKLVILKEDPVISIEKLTAKSGEFITLVAHITTSVTKLPVANGKYVFKVNGGTISNVDPETMTETTVQSITNGTAMLSTYVNIFWDDGLYNVTVVYSGNNHVNSGKYTAPVLTIKT